METNLARQLALVMDGRIDFSAFARATRREYARMALYLTRRWRPPAWYSDRDVAQELLVGTWLHMWSYDQTFADRKGGGSLDRYVVYNAMAHAKRCLHKARGAKLSGCPDKNPSRIERPFDPVPRQDDEAASFDSMVLAVLAEDAVAEEAIAEAEERAIAVESAVRHCETPRERAAVMALARAGDVDRAGEILYEDFELRTAMRFGSEAQAAGYAVLVAEAVISRMTRAA